MPAKGPGWRSAVGCHHPWSAVWEQEEEKGKDGSLWEEPAGSMQRPLRLPGFPEGCSEEPGGDVRASPAPLSGFRDGAIGITRPKANAPCLCLSCSGVFSAEI